MALAIHKVEKEYGVSVGVDYLLVKFNSQVRALEKWDDEQRQESERAQFNRR